MLGGGETPTLCPFMNLKTANAQSGHFSYKIEVQGIQKWYNSNCGTVLENYSSPINRNSTTELFHEFVLGMADGYTYRLARTSVDANVKFYIYWHSEAEPPDKVFVAIRHHEGGSLQVQCSPQIGSARANFRGYLHENISVAVSGGCGNQFACGNTVNFGEEDVHVYELPKSAFRRIDSNLCEAILVIPYSLSAMGVWDVYDFHGYRGTVATKNQSRTYGFVRYAVIEPVGER